MILKKLRLHNIRSYQDLELVFPKGSILLSGDVGVGKTSILLGLQFALFGLQPGQKGGSILRQGENFAGVSLEFEIDGKDIIVERTIKKSKNGSISQDQNIITINNERTELSTSEMKNKVISLLNYPKEFVKKSNLLYKFTVYTPQEEMKAIIQERPDVRLDTLRHIFGIDRYKRIKENSQIFLQRIKEAVKEKEGEFKEINLLKERLTLETEKKITLSREINNLTLEHQSILKQKQESKENLEELQRAIQEKQKLDIELNRNIISLEGKKDFKNRLEKELLSMTNQIKEKVSFSQEKYQEVSNLITKHKLLLEDMNSKFLGVNSRISVLNSKKEQAFQMKDKISSLDNCPTCFQTVSPEHKEKITKRSQYDIEECVQELEQKIQDKNRLISDIEREKELIQGYESDRSQLEKDKINSEHQKTIEIKIKSDAIVLDRSIQEMQEFEKNIIQLRERIETFKESEQIFQKKKSDFEMINNQLQEKEIRLAEKNKELEILKIHLETLQQDITRKEKIKGQVDYLRQLQDWMQEKFLAIITLTETNVLAKLRSEFSQVFSEWFSLLVTDNLSVRLDEDFTPIITNQDYEIDYDFLSGGERTAVALSYRLALNQILNSLLSKIKTKDLVILDEPTDGFSQEQLVKMRDIFDQLNSEQMILVSHEQKIEGFVDHVIKIKKEGTSSIESVSS